MMAAMPSLRTFPEGFLWGSATSSHQVEGGNQGNDWWAWEAAPGHIHDGTRSGDACDWWRGRAEEDLSLAAEYGQNAHRLGLEWSRLEPEPGRFDEAAFDRYRAILAHAHKLGLRSLVTLYHFSLPTWAAAQGWTAPSLAPAFARFAEACAQRLSPLVDLWATINEPLVLAFMAYFGRQWPPGLGSTLAFARAVRQLLRGHVAARAAVHRVQPDAQVGIVLNLPAFDAANPRDPRDRAVCKLQETVFNEAFLRALDGRYDFLGLNYYGRYQVAFDLSLVGRMFGRHVQTPTVSTPNTDWGQISPEGLTRQLLRVQRLGRPIYVTENGVYDNHDRVRPGYLRDHVRAVHDAIRAGADVRGYFHWSLVDNFEWAEGWAAHFGLFAVDRATQTRTPKDSARIYAEICRANAIACP